MARTDLVRLRQAQRFFRDVAEDQLRTDWRQARNHHLAHQALDVILLLHSLNPERILISVEAIGIGQNALARASTYAKDREVFDRPIGQNQSIQHPLAESWMELEAADQLLRSSQLQARENVRAS